MTDPFLLSFALHLVVVLAGACALFGLGAVAAGAIATQRFADATPAIGAQRTPITVLKPLCGDEPLLDEALASLCAQAYPGVQIVCGVNDPADPATHAVHRMQARFPDCDITLVSDPGLHGANRKVSNLINMLGIAKHDLLVISDSDLHVLPDYLDRIVAALAQPGVGLVTTICAGLPTAPGLAGRLGATAITHCFLPGALLSRALGRQDCLGTTMALTRDTLEAIGGLPTLVGHLADDNVLGRRVITLGLGVGLAQTVPLTAVPERSMTDLWLHELRWARTVRAVEPMLFALSALQYPLFWSAVALVCSAAAPWSILLFATCWLGRAIAAWCTDRVLRQGRRRYRGAPLWLLPVRDILSVALVAASFLGSRVVWRGQRMRADDGCSAPLRVIVPELS